MIWTFPGAIAERENGLAWLILGAASCPFRSLDDHEVRRMARQQPAPTEPLVPHAPITRYYAEESRRRGFVSGLFDTAAGDYEWINRVMSLGSGQRYRRDALERAGVGAGHTVLDVCMGSGQTSRAAVDLVGPTGRVVGLDASRRMLEEARRYVDIPMTHGRIEALPFPDGIADPYALARTLAERPGIVEHGLFLDMAHAVLVASAAGVRLLERAL